MDDRNERVNKMRNYRVLFPLNFVQCKHPIAIVNHVLERCLFFPSEENLKEHCGSNKSKCLNANDYK